MSTNTRSPLPHRTISAFEFEARCPAIIEEVRRNRRAVLITRRGKPIAQLSPFPRGRKERGRKAVRRERPGREFAWFPGPHMLPPHDEEPP